MKGALAGAGVAAVGASPARAGIANLVLPSLGIETRRSRTPVEHLVVVMMENRSVDHYLGWYGAENPAFDGRQHASFPDLRAGRTGSVATESWGQAGRNNFHGRGFEDPSHGWDGGRAERNGGACDGWLSPVTGNDELALSTYDALDLPVWAQLTRDYQAYDRWHCSLLGPTQPNRYYLHSAQSGGLKNNDLPPQLAAAHPEWALGWDWPTIWTLFETYGITCGYYFSNLPELAYWGARHVMHARHISEYYAAAATGTLPQVSIIDPWFSAPAGLANDDHPLADVRLGQAFLSDIAEAFATSPQYKKSALVMTYDEWGGFWDHVDPPRLPDDRGTPADKGGKDDFGQTGFRIPTTIVSPWTRNAKNAPGAVDHTTYEHSSILKFISDNWGLPYLTMRQRKTNSIESAFRGFKRFDPDPAFVPYEAPLIVTLEPTLESAGINVEDVLGPVADAVGQVPIPLSATKPTPVQMEGSDLHRLADTGWFDLFPFKLDWRFEDSFLRSRPELLADALAGLSK